MIWIFCVCVRIMFELWNFKREKQQKQEQPENKKYIHERWISFRLPVFDNILLKAKIPCEPLTLKASFCEGLQDNKKFNLQNENTQKESHN